MAVIVTRPVVVLPQYRITTAEICQVVDAQHEAQPEVSAERWREWRPRMDHTQVDTRYWVREPGVVLTDRDLERDLKVTFEQLADLAESAARDALKHAGVDPREVGSVVCTSTTGTAMPALDTHLVGRLGLSPRVRRLGVAQLGCGGAAWAAIRAHEQFRLYRRPVLIVAAEAVSQIVVSGNKRADAMVWKTLVGDGAAATVMREAAGAERGLMIDEDREPFEYLVPYTLGAYQQLTTVSGLDFLASRDAHLGVAKAAGPLRAWGQEQCMWPLRWAAVHTGGPAILQSTIEVLDLADDLLRWSWESLRAIGNCGSVGVWDVVRRMYDDPPASGAGALASYGPGFMLALLPGRWRP